MTLRPAAGIPPAGSALEGGEEGGGVEGNPLHGPNKGEHGLPPFLFFFYWSTTLVDRSTGQLDQLTGQPDLLTGQLFTSSLECARSGLRRAEYSMKNTVVDQSVGIPITYAHGIHEQVGTKDLEAVKRKLRLRARIVRGGGLQRVFETVVQRWADEKLLKVSQVPLIHHFAGSIAGLLFISLKSWPFPVFIPLKKIKRAAPSANVNNPREKYIKIVTVDNFDFWFVGFVNYKKSFKHIQQAICQSSMR
ncbi:hypothetical protein Sjap_007656 [Stephania japonica]|uniref:GRAM domain-containing protein n=1 Tax=Stephania japonica TaxID=461633 RepID=A0AAP0PAM2_9MAGN